MREAKEEPPHPTTRIKGCAAFLLPRCFPWEGQPLSLAVVYFSSTSSQAPPLGSVNHIAITCDITKGNTSAKYRKGSATVGRVSFALQATLLSSSKLCSKQPFPTVLLLSRVQSQRCSSSSSQLTSQQHLPSAFTLIKVQSQRSFSFSISLPPFPLLFLLYLLFFSLPICDVPIVQGLKNQNRVCYPV